jgi:predicted RNA binding protein YcfA (HicA-like mRNA interferase family)
VSQQRALTGKQLLDALHRLGFETVRIKGSHHFVRHPDGRRSVVPVHSGETIGPGLLRAILRQTELSHEQIQ